MALDIGGNLITSNTSVLTVNTGVSMTMLTTGGVVRPKQIQFQAIGNQGTAWVNFTDATWNKLPFPTTLVNINSCFDTTNSRFTAPVTGWYFLQASAYIVKNAASDAYYFHPIFAVNGNLNGRINTSYPNYRIRGYGIPFGCYHDTQITQVYELTAGDYVEHYTYVSAMASSGQYHSPYQRFTGFLLG
jgi:hypothetical protein